MSLSEFRNPEKTYVPEAPWTSINTMQRHPHTMTCEATAKIDDFPTRAKVFTLSTVDGDEPRARPLGLHMIVDGSIVFGVGDFKDVYKQIVANPKVEITACIGGEWLRLHGRAVRIEDDSVSERALDMVPPLRSIYTDETGHKLAMFRLENAKAEFIDMMTVKESYEL